MQGTTFHLEVGLSEGKGPPCISPRGVRWQKAYHVQLSRRQQEEKVPGHFKTACRNLEEASGGERNPFSPALIAKTPEKTSSAS